MSNTTKIGGRKCFLFYLSELILLSECGKIQPRFYYDNVETQDGSKI